MENLGVQLDLFHFPVESEESPLHECGLEHPFRPFDVRVCRKDLGCGLCVVCCRLSRLAVEGEMSRG